MSKELWMISVNKADYLQANGGNRETATLVSSFANSCHSDNTVKRRPAEKDRQRDKDREKVRDEIRGCAFESKNTIRVRFGFFDGFIFILVAVAGAVLRIRRTVRIATGG